MTSNNQLRVRRSITELQNEYKSGTKKPLEDLMRAWKGIKDLPPDDPRSFFTLGGFHGEPFRGAGWGNPQYWGGYCNHGNILFPTWHRVYLLKLEEALRSIKGCEDVTLPFWDETSDDSLKNGVPWALTVENFTLDGQTIPNPLRSFVFTKGITDNLNGDNGLYSKPKGYQTVRYPLSGLVGNEQDKTKTEAHNKNFPDFEQNVGFLNQNIVNWLTSSITVNGKVIPTNVKAQYINCLNAPNYTVFSNTTSSTQWNDDLDDPSATVVPLESPHNHIHLAVGGFDVVGQPPDFSPIQGANGDMGENDTAGLDPIFYFHHSFVDRVFWLWQKKHGFTDYLDVITGYPGTNSVDNQGPTPGTAPNSWLTLDSPLDPFRKKEDRGERAYTSRDGINIEKQLGYTYGPGSLEDKISANALEQTRASKSIRVSGINRASIRGSFVIAAFANIDGKRQLLGTEAVLSRWNVRSCANCQTHLEMKAFVPLRDGLAEAVPDTAVEVEVHTRDGRLEQVRTPENNTLPVFEKKPFRVEVR